MKPLLPYPDHAVWLLPSPDFRVAAFESRGTISEIADQTSDPRRAHQNLLERDQLFTDRLRAETRALGLQAIEVHTSTTEDALLARVRSTLSL